jgi:hypothetical protein
MVYSEMRNEFDSELGINDDAALKAGLAMTIVSPFLGGFAFACAVLTTCVALSQGTLVVASALSFLAAPLAAAALIFGTASSMRTHTEGDFGIE